jgi:hypothetical protein
MVKLMVKHQKIRGAWDVMSKVSMFISRGVGLGFGRGEKLARD